jgi:hypothetical protein
MWAYGCYFVISIYELFALLEKETYVCSVIIHPKNPDTPISTGINGRCVSLVAGLT